MRDVSARSDGLVSGPDEAMVERKIPLPPILALSQGAEQAVRAMNDLIEILRRRDQQIGVALDLLVQIAQGTHGLEPRVLAAHAIKRMREIEKLPAT